MNAPAPVAPAFHGDVRLAVRDEEALAALIRCWRVNPALAFCDRTHPAHGPAYNLFGLTRTYLSEINTTSHRLINVSQQLDDIRHSLTSFQPIGPETHATRTVGAAGILMNAATGLAVAQSNVAVMVTAYRAALPACAHRRGQHCSACADARRADARRLEGCWVDKIDPGAVSDVERYVIDVLYGRSDKCLTSQDAYEIICVAQGL